MRSGAQRGVTCSTENEKKEEEIALGFEREFAYVHGSGKNDIVCYYAVGQKGVPGWLVLLHSKFL